jgi:hypothetical protein
MPIPRRLRRVTDRPLREPCQASGMTHRLSGSHRRQGPGAGQQHPVSMPLVSDWGSHCKKSPRDVWENPPFLCPWCRAGVRTSRPPRRLQPGESVFLCPWCRAGVRTRGAEVEADRAAAVSMPLVSGWGSHDIEETTANWLREFLCPWCRAGVRTEPSPEETAEAVAVSMPLVSGWGSHQDQVERLVGLRMFLCPWCRAGVRTAREFRGI